MRGYYISANGETSVQSLLGPIEPEDETLLAGFTAMEKNNIWFADQTEDWGEEDSQ